MNAEKVNLLEIFSGDDDGILIEFRNPANDQAVDISSFTDIVFTLRDKKFKKILEKSLGVGGIVFVTDGTDGQATIVLETRDTHNLKGEYIYDVQFIDASGVTSTGVKSFLIIKEDVTISTTGA